jgi:hypothetical protein
MTTWRFLINPFLVSAQGNRSRAVTISTYTDGALFARQADLFFGGLYAIYHPLHDALMAEDAQWQSQLGTQKGSTATLDDLFELLSPRKIGAWDLSVQNVFNKGTPGYIAVFPNGHHPYQSGKKDERILAVEALSNSLGVVTAPPAFAPIKLDVDAFLLSVQDARTAQTGAKSKTATESDEATAATTNAMIGLYAVLGACINKFPDNPTSIEPLFDLETIRDLEQTKWINHVAFSANKNLFKRTLQPNIQLRLKVNSTEPLTFYFAAEANDAPGVVSVTVQGLEEETVNASQLGNVPASAFFKVSNTSALVEGHFEVEIL